MGLNYREKTKICKFRDTGPLIRAIFAERESRLVGIRGGGITGIGKVLQFEKALAIKWDYISHRGVEEEKCV